MSSKYDKLAKNTIIFAIGSLSSKLLVFLLMPLYTRILSPADFGTSEILISSSNLIMPFLMLSINEAIIRYGMEKNVKRKQVFSIGLRTVLIGFLVFLLALPILSFVDVLGDYKVLILFYVLMGCLRSICSQFTRAIGQIKIFTIDGIFATLTTILFNIVFLLVFKMGIVGYVLSIVMSNVVSVIFLFVVADLSKYVIFKKIDKRLQREMFKYSIPLIPSTMFWWITNVSDRYLVKYFCGDAVTGIYSFSYKIPTLLTIFSVIFYQAWQISAIEEHSSPRQAVDFYSEVIDYYSALLSCAASGMIMLCIPITYLLASSAFFDSWQYVPFLVIAEMFSTLVTFLGTFYMVAKKSNTVLLAIGVGGISNILMNFYLIPKYGAMGAALATMISYLLSFLVRLVDVRRFIAIRVNLLRMSLSFLLLVFQTTTLFGNSPQKAIYQLIFLLLNCMLNQSAIKTILLTLLKKLKHR